MAPSRTINVDHERSRRRWAPAGDAKKGRGGPGASRLVEVEGFGANPGRIGMLAYAPGDLPAGAPLVVVLHGCTQNARAYDAAAGWTALADERGFAVLYPEQRKANNAMGCFNWFELADQSRGLGETRSIREMIAAMQSRHGLDPRRTYVVGLSAGGAMTAALLAAYPEAFEAGAVIAGLPCGAATGMQEALEAMSRPAERTSDELGDLVRAGGAHVGPWPRISIWHGSADRTVTPRNADDLVRQWLNVHGADPGDFRQEVEGRRRRRVWTVNGRDIVESNILQGVGHGAPLDKRLGETAAPYMLDLNLSSTREIAAFFGLTGRARAGAADAPRAERTAPLTPDEILPPPRQRPGSGRGGAPGDGDGGDRRPGDRFGVGETITKALRAAGLMR
jgi:poly(hydroxyalkanoate) depolymerase family esterase